MKKIFLLTAILFVISVFAYSQDKKTNPKKVSFNAGLQTTLAVGDLANTHGFGLGANAMGEYRFNNSASVTGRVSYTHLFGKKYGSSYYEPGGGGGSYSGHYDGMNDIGITGGARYYFNKGLFMGGELGLCIDSGGGESETAGLGSGEFGYSFHCRQTPLEYMISLFFGLCGDPKVQVGLRYSIRF